MSPLGDEAVAGLEAESVEPLEVRHLLEGDIMPFGQRMSAERAAAYVSDARVDELGQRLRQTLESVEPDIELDDALIRKVAADAYENMTASPAEGIEVREHPKRENR